MADLTLVGLAYSPWTQRAQWALEHHGIRHAFEPYVPVVGEPLLRLRTRKLRGRVSVPVLLTPHGPVWDSLAIARYADAFGRGSKLYEGHEAAVAHWLPVAERALEAARCLVLRAIDRSPLAQEESVSLPLPRVLAGPAARFGTHMLRRKYGAHVSEEDAEARIVNALERLRSGLSGGYLDGEFSLADVVMAGVVQSIAPVDDRFVRLAPGTRAAWTRPGLAARFADLVAWRDDRTRNTAREAEH